MPEQRGSRGFQMKDETKPAGPSPGAGDADQGFMFASLVLSLSTSALIHLGQAPRGEAESESSGELDLPMAHQVIDILEVLRDKTRGNLDENEQKMLDEVLHDLHLRYVEKRDA